VFDVSNDEMFDWTVFMLDWRVFPREEMFDWTVFMLDCRVFPREEMFDWTVFKFVFVVLRFDWTVFKFVFVVLRFDWTVFMLDCKVFPRDEMFDWTVLIFDCKVFRFDHTRAFEVTSPVTGCPVMVPDTFRFPFTYNFANVVLSDPMATLEIRYTSPFGPLGATFDH
jgi:hypothetical protein